MRVINDREGENKVGLQILFRHLLWLGEEDEHPGL